MPVPTMEPNSSRGEDLLLLVAQGAEQLGDVGEADLLIGQDLAIADLARDFGVGLDDALERCGGEAFDALVDRTGGGAGLGPLVGRVGVAVFVSMLIAIPLFFIK